MILMFFKAWGLIRPHCLISESMKLKPAYITIQDKDGNIIERIPMTAADDDWIRAARLKKKAEAGDKEAAKKLKEMENTQMMEVVDDDNDNDDE